MATAELVAEAIEKAIEVCGMPKGTFNMIFGGRIGANLVEHPSFKQLVLQVHLKEEWRFITLRRAAFSRFHFC